MIRSRLWHLVHFLCVIQVDLPLSQPTGIVFVDSIKLQVCHNLRIPRHHGFNWKRWLSE
ncbi:transposase [Candidatus Enterovibrio escicola]|uniref:transposase n=1 Tax=Candidatus Enterovibrio escicola TaxID=1927127 RepID=UPI0011BA58E3|nr:transposase [Candidatus Enterovibrio escacola]